MFHAPEPIARDQLHDECSGWWHDVDPPVLMEDLEAADFVLEKPDSECKFRLAE